MPQQGGERRDVWVHSKTIEKRVYQTLEVTSNNTSVFCRKKKDSKKRIVQDYRYLNEWTVKNNYPLPLILNIVENIGTKKTFTKINLRWNYNNVKEDDEWKMVFMTPEGVFKPMIMFFELTNSMAIQTMMNKIF